MWGDDYAEGEDDDDEYVDEGDDGDDGEYTIPMRRSSAASSTWNLRPRRRSSTSTSSRYRPYPDYNDTASLAVTGSSSPPSASLPKNRMARQVHTLPVPVPNLTKKSRGRRVPTVDSLGSGDKDRKGSAKQSNNEGECKNERNFVCHTTGCGKCFARGEHLKRHIRSIHTYEKRESLRFILLKMYPHRLISI